MTCSTPGKRSGAASDLRGLEEALPTTQADVAALRRASDASRMTPADIASALAQLGTLPPDQLRSRPGPRGEPFELPADPEP
jgi:hypothetical protein